jgi:hypothetical protein
MGANAVPTQGCKPPNNVLLKLKSICCARIRKNNSLVNKHRNIDPENPEHPRLAHVMDKAEPDCGEDGFSFNH